MAEFSGADDNQIRRQGRWNSQAMENCYLTTIPREAVRGLAGFDPKRPSFCLPRASLAPPDRLVSLVFPWIDDWVSKRDAGSLELTICLDSFLKTMKFLRVVLLQDAVCLKRQFPDLFIWTNALFTTSEFLEFEKRMERCIAESSRPDDQRIREILPNLISRIGEEFSAIRSSVSANLAAIERTLGNVEHLSEKFDDVFSGRTNLSLNVPLNGRKGPAGAPTFSGAIKATEDLTVKDNLQVGQPENAVAISSAISAAESAAMHIAGNQQLESIPPVYKMSRSVLTVFDMWREWTTGIGGAPSVKCLEDAWGAKWRISPTESRFFNRRKIIIDHVYHLTKSEGKTVSEAVRFLDNRINASKKSLDWLQKQIKIQKIKQ